jgi:hypothetical protein
MDSSQRLLPGADSIVRSLFPKVLEANGLQILANEFRTLPRLNDAGTVLFACRMLHDFWLSSMPLEVRDISQHIASASVCALQGNPKAFTDFVSRATRVLRQRTKQTSN